MSSFRLRSSQFRREREGAWGELEVLVARAELKGIRFLDAGDVLSLAALYRHAVGSLATARAISLDRNLLDYLEGLVARAHLCIYGYRQGPREALARFVGSDFPRTVRRFGLHVAAALTMLLAAVGAGSAMVASDPERYYDVVGAEAAQGRTPTASTEELRKVLYGTGGDEAFDLETFATFLFTNNAKVGLLCAATGIAAGLPVPVLLASNGLTLGGMAELYRSRGLAVEFWGWILPHGVSELLAIALCAAAGLAFGGALLFPQSRTRRDALSSIGRQAAILVLGAVGMFLIAAIIEGIFRQSVQDPAARWAVALASLLLWAAYFTFGGRNRGRDPD
jgi:uncharacterized membrane protein SpoIIM required for sporulation